MGWLRRGGGRRLLRKEVRNDYILSLILERELLVIQDGGRVGKVVVRILVSS
jgi:hypothetical protein